MHAKLYHSSMNPSLHPVNLSADLRRFTYRILVDPYPNICVNNFFLIITIFLLLGLLCSIFMFYRLEYYNYFVITNSMHLNIIAFIIIFWGDTLFVDIIIIIISFLALIIAAFLFGSIYSSPFSLLL